MDYNLMLDVISEEGRVCEVCRYEHICYGGVSGGPNGPIYPPCADNPDVESGLYSLSAIEAVYQEIMGG